MSGLHLQYQRFFFSKNLIGQFCITKIHTWFRGWGEWNRRNELFVPESQCDLFCFTPLSLESLTWILVTRFELAHFVMLVWKLFNPECDRNESGTLNKLCCLKQGSGMNNCTANRVRVWRPRRHTSCMSPPPGAFIVEVRLYCSWGGSRRGGGGRGRWGVR